MRRFRQAQSVGFWLIGALVLAAAVVGLSPAQMHAEPAQAMAGDIGLAPETTVLLTAVQQPTPPVHPAADFACNSCHAETQTEIEFPSGEQLPVQVDLAALAMSAHGDQAENPLACMDCHQTVNDYQYPHTPMTAGDLRDYQLASGELCERCHASPHITSHAGKDAVSPVTCTDCHGSHEVRTAEAWDSGEAVAACVNCHEQAGVALTDADQMIPLIRNGLFADEVDNDYCLACHSQPGVTMTFPNGDVKSVTVDAEAFHTSVHGIENSWDALQCTDCHQNYQFPHEEVTIESAREYTVMQNQVCEACHVQFFEKALDSVHGAALLDGNLDAAVCTDCHGSHDTVMPSEQPHTAIAQTCEQCHSEIYNEYAESVHGAVLIEDDNEDVPTCIDCHGVHDIHDPTTAQARARSPELCATCHADDELMAKYDISTEVFDTYVADFHGTTVMLFDYEHEGVAPNTAVCYDCHGVHNIKSPSDPDAEIHREPGKNLPPMSSGCKAEFCRFLVRPLPAVTGEVSGNLSGRFVLCHCDTGDVGVLHIHDCY